MSNIYAKNHYYHLFNRGASRGLIFFNPGNYEYCLRLVKRYLPKYHITMIAYCLMPNHYHFLLRQEGDAPISRFINTLFNAYVQAVNIQQERTGTLFEGRAQHVLVDRDEYARHLCRYIHLNPVKAGLAAAPELWPYSNYSDWLGLRAGTLKDERFIRMYWPSPDHYRRFVAMDVEPPANFTPAGGWESFKD